MRDVGKLKYTLKPCVPAIIKHLFSLINMSIEAFLASRSYHRPLKLDSTKPQLPRGPLYTTMLLLDDSKRREPVWNHLIEARG
jgi:hypothetical protein